jgi:hypothetical protein
MLEPGGRVVHVTPYRPAGQVAAGGAGAVQTFTFLHTGLAPGFRYCYRVQPITLQGWLVSAPGPVCATTPACPPATGTIAISKPAASSSLRVGVQTEVAWTAPAGASSFTLIFQRQTVSGRPSPATFILRDPQTRSAQIPASPFQWTPDRPSAGQGDLQIRAFNADNCLLASGQVGQLLVFVPTSGGTGTPPQPLPATGTLDQGNRFFGYFRGNGTLTLDISRLNCAAKNWRLEVWLRVRAPGASQLLWPPTGGTTLQTGKALTVRDLGKPSNAASAPSANTQLVLPQFVSCSEVQITVSGNATIDYTLEVRATPV